MVKSNELIDKKKIKMDMNKFANFIPKLNQINLDQLGKFKKIPLEAYENEKSLIDKVIHETRREHCSDTKIYFKHPRYRHHMCDIFGGVFKFDCDYEDPKRLVIYDDYIFLELKNDITIKYKYMMFKRECFNLPVQCCYNKFLDEDENENDSENDSENESLDSSSD